MVKALRKDNIKITVPPSAAGLYVVGRSNACDLNIPHLPTLTSETLESITTDVSPDGTARTNSDVTSYLAEGDIVWLDQRFQQIRTVLSSKANANTLLVTERCENRCTFCSQPPNDLPDTMLYTNATLSLLNFNSAEYVGISGGEPTYNRAAFLAMLNTLRVFGNATSLHILSNGRSLADKAFAKKVKDVLGDREVLWGIPLYGHRSLLHDRLVGSSGAFKETLQGLLALGEMESLIELRIVPTRQNIRELPNIISFVTTALPFINCISIMNLEPKGWARKLFDTLHVPVRDQSPFLLNALEAGKRRLSDIRLFNYPLCLLNPEIRQFAYKSISDWKNYYPEECNACGLRSQCGGFFTSAQGKFIEKVEAQL